MAGRENMKPKSEMAVAIENGDCAAVAQLLDNGADPNDPTLWDGSTPLLVAIDDAALVELLLARGADPNLRGYGGVTPLQSTIDTELETAKYRYDVGGVDEDPSTEVLAILLRAGADPRLTDDDGHNAFDWARKTGNYTAEAVLRAWVPPSPPPRLR
jgi:ankyrin repeat protein